MGKTQTKSAIIVACAVVALLIILAKPWTLVGKGIEEIFKGNQGMIWLITMAFITIGSLVGYLVIIFQQALKKLYGEMNAKNETISGQNEVIKKQNDKIIETNLDYIGRIDTLTKAVNKNYEQDTKKYQRILDTIHSQQQVIDGVLKRVGDFEDNIKSTLHLNTKISEQSELIKSNQTLLVDHNRQIYNLEQQVEQLTKQRSSFN